LRQARNLLVVTIDTLRADHVGAYGDRTARTPAWDALAARGTRFDFAYAAAPITLASHASLFTGRYPPAHGAWDNGVRMGLQTPTLAEMLAARGLTTAAFVGAFPLDRRFGLIKGFQTYGDRMPRGTDGRPLNERPGRMVVDEALEWLAQHRSSRFFLWVHLFEPHAPYGNPADPAQAHRPALDRYDDDIAEADRQMARLLAAVDDIKDDTLVIAAADHGEAFGEHGEISHSVFAYDTTLRVPLVMAGPDIPIRVVTDPVSLVDVAPTAMAHVAPGPRTWDGVDLSALLAGRPLPDRALYAETRAPLFDFGWSPLKTIRLDGWKYIDAPSPELYDLARDPGETSNLFARERNRASALAAKLATFADVSVASGAQPGDVDREALSRLAALGYANGRTAGSTGPRPDPKDRRAIAARFGEVASGELRGDALESALREILKADPKNPQAHVRLGYVLLDRGRAADARAHFEAAIAEHLPSVDAHLGLAQCQIAAKDTQGALRTLSAAEALEPDNPVVSANLGVTLSDTGDPAGGIPHLHRAISLDPDLSQARFSLAVAYGRLGRRTDAAREAEELLRRLPPDAPQRGEVRRLLEAVR